MPSMFERAVGAFVKFAVLALMVLVFVLAAALLVGAIETVIGL